MKKLGIISLKVLLWIIGVVIFLVLMVFVLIRVPSVQDFARKKAVSYLQGKIGTKVEINKVSLEFPKLVVLEDVYFEDQKKDTLIAGDTLKVDISMMKLLHNQIEINEIDLRGITANISRTPDSVFNFDYIMKAFVSDQKKPVQPTDTTSAMKFSISKINLDRIKGKFNDAITANNVNYYIGHFDTKVQDFDLDKMKFNIPAMNLSGVNAKIIQSKPAAVAESKAKDVVDAAKPIYLDLTLGKVDLDRIKIDYQNDVSAMNVNVNLGKLKVEPDKIDLKTQRILLKSVAMANSNIVFRLGKTAQAKIVSKEISKEVEVQKNNWWVSLANANFSNNNIKFDNFNMPVQGRGIDYGHLDIKNFNLQAANFVYSIDTISGNIKSGSFKDKSGLDLRKVQTDFFYGKNRTTLNNLYIATNRTILKNRVQLIYPSIASLSTNPGALRVDANLNGNKLAFKDVLIFMPSMATIPPFNSNPNAVLNINGQVNGSVSNLNIPNLEISGLRNTHIHASGRIKGLPDMNKAYFDLNIKDFSTRSSDLAAFAPAGSIPTTIRLPEAIKLQGTFKGGITNFSTNMNLNSSFGSAKTIATYNAAHKGAERYKANVSLFNFNVGRLIKQEKTIGNVTAVANINGVGIDPKHITANFSGKVIKAGYNNYTYRNLSLSGKAVNGAISAKANMADRNLSFALNTKANMNRKYPQIYADLKLDSINLKALNFTPDDIRFHGNLVADLQTADPDYLNGNILLTNAILARSGERFQLDSVSVISTANADSSTLKLRAEVATANIAGKYKLTQVGTALQDVVNKYFSTGPVVKTAKYSPQQMRFTATVVNAPILAKFIPALKEMATVNLNGNFDSQTGQLVVNASAPSILYGTNSLKNLGLKINTANNALNYTLNVGQISNAQIQLQNTSISGNAQNNILTTNILVRDKSNKEHYRIAGALRALPSSSYAFSLNQDGLVLNYQPWTVGSGNEIQFGGQGIQAKNFVISNNNQSLSVNTTPPGFNNPLNIAFSNFKIETLTQMVKKDSLLVGGTINGNALVSNLQTTPVFTANMTVGDFNFRGDTLGNIALKVNNRTTNTLAADVSISGKGNQANLTGNYFLANSTMDMKLNIANLNLKSIEGFTMGAMNRASGSINGQLAITGSASAPQVRGGVNFNQAAFNLTMLNSYYKIKDNQLTFNKDGIQFNDFTLIDSAGNYASLNGMLYTKTYTDYAFDLRLRADNFKVMNSTAKNNSLYYGQMFINTNLHIGGNMNAPAVDGSLKVNPETKFTIVLPQTDPGIVDREGIVKFVDFDNPDLAKTLSSQVDSLKQSALVGMDVSVNIEIDKLAEFNIIVDQGNGDFLKVRGDAQLNGGIDPSGKITLTGTYQLEEGAYELSFNFLKRRFDIKKGSSITWNGDPTTGNMDVTAVYTANTAPIDLVQNMLGDAAPAQLNIYKQKLPFQVNLNLKGELLKPIVAFDVVLPEKNYNVATEVTTNVNTRLTQLRGEPSEMNKQVFALLLLNRFVGENPFASSAGGGGAQALVRGSVSKLLSEQLNSLAGNLIAGVDLNFDLQSNEDYTTGTMQNRTDLNVGLSKRLLNDRLKVNVGSNFELEGPRQQGAKTSNFAGNISVEYQLSQNGRYLLRAYQKNEYQVALQGQVIETGISFIINMDYNKFKEIFAKSPAAERKRKKAERAAKKEETTNE